MGEWCEEQGLVVADTFRVINRRGTWRHPGTKEYYELDYFVMTPSLMPRIQCMRTSAAMPFTDHFAKVVRIVFHSRDKAPPWWRLESSGLRQPARLQVDRMTGPTPEAQAKGESYQKTLDERVKNIDRPITWEALSEAMVGAADQVCGRSRASKGPLGRLGHEGEARQERDRIAQLWEEVREAQGTAEEEPKRQVHRTARVQKKRRRWTWDEVEEI